MDPLDTIGGHELKEYPDGGGRSKESLVQKNGGLYVMTVYQRIGVV